MFRVGQAAQYLQFYESWVGDYICLPLILFIDE